MPSNEQKRAAAKRKLQRQLARRAERARQRQRLQLVLAAVIVIAVVGAGVWYWGFRKPAAKPAPPASTTPTAEASCAFKPAPEPAAKETSRPADGPAVTTPPTQEVTLKTSQGDIPLTLDRAKAPCAVASFLSLAAQNYFDNTKCHRLVDSADFAVLQCGDPKGDGSGGPGYSFADEYPTKGTVATVGTSLYKRGTIAMANSGPDTNGSQFFLVYKDTNLPPKYTIFGTIGEPGLKVLDKVGAGGTQPGTEMSAGGGAPKIPVAINSVDIPAPSASSSAPEPSAPSQPLTPGH